MGLSDNVNNFIVLLTLVIVEIVLYFKGDVFDQE